MNLVYTYYTAACAVWFCTQRDKLHTSLKLNPYTTAIIFLFEIFTLVRDFF